MDKTLTLREFVSSALVDINEAVKDASKEGVRIAYQKYETGTHPTIKSIEFDIAVELTESQSKDSKTGTGLQLSILNLGIDKSKGQNSDTKNVNRIRFSVDAFLGMEKDEEE